MKGEPPARKPLAKTGNLCYPEPVPAGYLSCAAASLHSFSGLWMEDHPRQGFSPGFTIQHAAVHSVVQNQIALPGILHQNLIIHPKNPLTFGWFYTMIILREHLFGARRRLRFQTDREISSGGRYGQGRKDERKQRYESGRKVKGPGCGPHTD